ncbi:hypothetical protein ACTFIR_000084 [Dictyostelium discoideum]
MKLQLIIFFFIIFNKTISGLINSQDGACLSTIITKTKQTSNYVLKSGEDYCSTYGDSFYFDCSPLGYVGAVRLINVDSSFQLSPSNFACFTYPVLLEISSGGNITSNFFDDISNLKLKAFLMTSTEIKFNRVFYFSQLAKFEQFWFHGSYINATYFNDLTTNINFSWFYVSTNNLPNMTNVDVDQCVLYLSQWFDQSSFSNLKTCNQISSLSIDGSYSNKTLFDFPIEILNRGSATYSFLSFSEMNFKKPTSPLDFINQTVSTLSFVGINSDFLIDSQLPFININNNGFRYQSSSLKNISNFPLITKNQNSIYLSSNGINSELEFFVPVINNGLRTLYVDYNKLVGTVSEKFCELSSFRLSSNTLSGTLPSCYTCHFGNSTFKNTIYSSFGGTGLTNVNLNSSCSTIVPNLRFDFVKNRTYLFGKNLGFDTNGYFTSTPSASWIVDIPSISFYKKGTETSYFDVYFRFANLKFHVTATPSQPIIDNIYVSEIGELKINGTNFGYNTSIISVVGLDNNSNEINCTITKATFNQIICSILQGFNSSTYIVDANTTITVGQLQSNVQLTIIPDFLNQYLSCSTNCTGNSFCDRNTGSCICDCKSTQECNIKSKLCISGPCPNDCTSPSNGVCNISKGVCECINGYGGVSCQEKQHFVTSITSTSNNGGNVTMSGQFFDQHNGLSITIGSVNCKGVLINETILICSLEASSETGIKSVKVSQNGLDWIGKNSFQYENTNKACPNDCTSSSNGKCDSLTGQCKCVGNFKGYDCSSITGGHNDGRLESGNSNGGGGGNSLPPSIPTIDNDNGVAVISNQELDYVILITNLVELDFNGKQVKSFDLQGKWVYNKNKSNLDLSVFSQNILDDINTNCIISSTLEIVEKDKNYTFAGVEFLIEAGSIKVSVGIENYKFISSLNTLQIQMKSDVTEDINKKENDCNDQDTKVETQDENSLSAINYIEIKKNGKTLFGRLINQAVVDYRPTLISSSIISKDQTSVIVGLNLPHFTTSCLIDPDFSVLLSTDFKSSCDSSNRPSYVLPLAVALPIGGAFTIAATTFFIVKKRKENRELKGLQSRISMK